MSGGLIGFHREDFSRVLVQHLSPSCRTHCSKRLWTYKQSAKPHAHAPIELAFEDGTAATCDVLVGADGIRSCVRRSMMREQATRARLEQRPQDLQILMGTLDPSWSGSIAYRAHVKVADIQARAPNHRACHQPTQVRSPLPSE